MTKLADVQQRAVDEGRKHGIDVCVIHGDAWAPAGYIMRASGCHCCCVPEADALDPRTAWRGLIRDIREGIEPCTFDDCEICKQESGRHAGL